MIRDMDAESRVRLEEIMRRLVDDEAAAVQLYLEFGGFVRNALVRLLRDRRLPRPPAEELDELTLDACLELGRVARGWQPDGGALPWNWARPRLAKLASDRLRALGMPIHLLDDDPADAALPTRGPTADLDPVAMLEALAAGDERCALVLSALRGALSPRELGVLLRYDFAARAGDPSPSHTVAAELAMQPPAVRQVASRARRRLRAAVAADPALGAIEATGLLTGPRAKRAAAA
jgi:DNA-directed RNA polymerase specialized sigma24 family protein